MSKRKANPDFYRQGFKALFTRTMSLEDYGKLKESEKPKIVGRSTIADKQEFIVELTEAEITDPARMEKHVREQLERETSSGKYLNPQTGKKLFCERRLEALTDYENILFPEPHNLTHRNELRQYESLLEYRKALEAVCGGRMDRYPPFNESPFTTPEAFDIFKYLNDNYNTVKHLRWTVLYQFLTDNNIEDDKKMSGRQYLKWVQQNFEPQMKSINLQGLSDDSSNREHGILTKLYSKRNS